MGAPRINEAIRAAKNGVRKTLFAADQMVCFLQNGQETLHAFGKTANKSGLHEVLHLAKYFHCTIFDLEQRSWIELYE